MKIVDNLLVMPICIQPALKVLVLLAITIQFCSEKAIISPAAGLRAKSIISPAMFTYENPYLA